MRCVRPSLLARWLEPRLPSTALALVLVLVLVLRLLLLLPLLPPLQRCLCCTDVAGDVADAIFAAGGLLLPAPSWSKIARSPAMAHGSPKMAQNGFQKSDFSQGR